ncbi:unnamed protein product, partial [Meganyctiphanes norvegica]
VRSAIQDDEFCTKLAEVSIPVLSLSQITSCSEHLDQVKMSVEHMARVSDIASVILQFLRTALFFWHRYYEDVQPRQARVQTLRNNTKDLKVAMAQLERSIRDLKKEIENLTDQLKEQEDRKLSLEAKKEVVEEDLAGVLAVITELQPHSKRWAEEMSQQEDVVNKLSGECLLDAVSWIYLAILPPDASEDLKKQWQKHLIDLKLLSENKTLSDTTNYQELRLVSHPGDLQQDVFEAVKYHITHSNILLLKDPHLLATEYLGVDFWIAPDNESENLLHNLKKRIESEKNATILLKLQHDAGLNVLKG